ncbi:MAG: glycosyltransferase [Ignavibacteria bacterium]
MAFGLLRRVLDSRPADERDVLVVIPAFRNPRQLDQCLAAVARQSAANRIETYVRDNSEDNIYFTAAINEGLRHGLRNPAIRYFLILNQDCYLNEDAVEQLVSYMEREASVGICAPIQLDSRDPSQVIWGGASVSFPYGQCFVGALKDAPGPFETPWASGAAAMIRREVLVDIGLLDGNMRFICSDSDYSFTARARGWRIVCQPAARCIHEMGEARLPGSMEIRQVMRDDVAYFMDKWISGALFQRLEFEGIKTTNEELQRQGKAYLERLAPPAPAPGGG